jgi:superfamily I DNA and/or RNA helicase
MQKYMTSDNDEATRVLAVTHSNGAADVLLEALLQMGVPAVRLGRPAAVSPNVQHRTIVALTEKMPQVIQLRQEAADLSLDKHIRSDAAFQIKQCTQDIQNFLMESAPVVVTSCIGAHQLFSSLSSSKRKFPIVVLDEAAQTTEPALLCPLAAAQADQLILVGDTRQLPPTITSMKLRNSLGVSPMARLESNGVDEKTLTVQYRMSPGLLEFPSKYFYKGLVVCSENADKANDQLPLGFAWPRNQPLAFVQVGNGNSEVAHNFGGRSNPTEAHLVARIVFNMLTSGEVKDTGIAVISPYSKQVQLIRTELAHFFSTTLPKGKNLKMGNVRVGTVDSFQGQEKEVIIISSVRSNPLRELGFLRDSRRLCVAITRAKRGLILLGDAPTLRSCRHWSSLLDSCEQRACTVEEETLQKTFISDSSDPSTQLDNRQKGIVKLQDKVGTDNYYGLF